MGSVVGQHGRTEHYRHDMHRALGATVQREALMIDEMACHGNGSAMMQQWGKAWFLINASSPHRPTLKSRARSTASAFGASSSKSISMRHTWQTAASLPQSQVAMRRGGNETREDTEGGVNGLGRSLEREGGKE